MVNIYICQSCMCIKGKYLKQNNKIAPHAWSFYVLTDNILLAALYWLVIVINMYLRCKHLHHKILLSSVFRLFWYQIMIFQFVLYVLEYTEGDLSQLKIINWPVLLPGEGGEEWNMMWRNSIKRWGEKRKIGKGGRKKTGRTRKERRILVRVKCLRCPWVLQTELSVHYSRHFILSLSLGYFSPRRGCPRVLKFCMGF